MVGAEILSTGQRVRALRRHRIPRLGEALAHADLALEQSEHEDPVRRRFAAHVVGGSGPTGHADNPVPGLAPMAAKHTESAPPHLCPAGNPDEFIQAL